MPNLSSNLIDLPHLTMCIDKNLHITKVSESVIDWLNYSQDAIESRSVLNFVPINQVSRLKQALLDKKERSIRFSFVTEIGEQKHVSVNIVNTRNAAKIMYIHDITDAIDLESKNKYMDRVLHVLEDIAQVGHWRIDMIKETVFWSDQMYAIHQVSAKEYKPDLPSSLSFYHPDDVQRVTQQINCAMREGKEINFSAKITRPAGENRHVKCSAVVIRSEISNAIESIVGVLQDVTELEYLTQEKELLTSAVRATSAGIVITDANRNVIWVNRGFESMTGYKFSDVEGQSLKGFLQGPETDPNTVADLKACLDAKQPVSVEILN